MTGHHCDVVRAGLIAAVFAALVLVGVNVWNTTAAPPTRDDAGAPTTPPPFVKDTVAGGTHWRFETSKRRGPVHVWIPANYEPATAGIVIYIHGFFTTVDKSWNERGLAEQFANSKRNALFIACEAPTHGEGHISWESPQELIVTVREQTDVQRPFGPITIVGHSGAHRTVRRWLGYRRINHIILLDAMYGHASAYTNWLAQPKSHNGNRLTIVAIDTLAWTEVLWHRRKDMLVFDRVPTSLEELPHAARHARLLYFRSQFGHMDLVLKRQAIPVLLQLTRLEPL